MAEFDEHQRDRRPYPSSSRHIAACNATTCPCFAEGMAERDALKAENERLREWTKKADADVEHSMLTLCNDADEYADLVHARRNISAALASTDTQKGGKP